VQSTALPQPTPPESSGAVDRTIPPEYDLSYRDARLGTETLIRIEAHLQGPLGPFDLSPSVYFRTKEDDRTTIRNGRPGG
jgi:hypothetical protein